MFVQKPSGQLIVIGPRAKNSSSLANCLAYCDFVVIQAMMGHSLNSNHYPSFAREGGCLLMEFLHQASMIARVSANASIPYLPYSRPTPEYLNPPQGASASSVMLLITTRPARS
jgi:hypothetical protein